jgi:hypothetical protein
MKTVFYLVRDRGDQLEILDRKEPDNSFTHPQEYEAWDVHVLIAIFGEQRFRAAIQSLQDLRIVDGHYYALLSRNLAFYDLGVVENYDPEALAAEALKRHAGPYEQSATVFTAAQASEILRMGLYSLQCLDQEKQNDASTGTSSTAG